MRPLYVIAFAIGIVLGVVLKPDPLLMLAGAGFCFVSAQLLTLRAKR